ncbi:MAG TPA: hypothetical protein VGJ99_07015 [Actinomycetota bacterium]|jgi:hypothetical protein
MATAGSISRSASVSLSHVLTGALVGVVAAIVMAMFAMVAAATYQGTGFFTPLYHIASALIDPATMMRSMEAAANGDAFTFSAGPAAVGVALHLLTGAFWGAIFGLIVSAGRLNGWAGLLAGIVYGLAVMLVMSFVALPVIAEVFGGGDPISEMPRLVGWGTFAIEHALYGAVLGLWPLLKGSEARARRPVQQPAA